MYDIVAIVHFKNLYIATAQDNVEMDCPVHKIKLESLFYVCLQLTQQKASTYTVSFLIYVY